MNPDKETICSLMSKAKKLWFEPNRCTRDELESLAENLYIIVEQMHLMGEKMEQRLEEYKEFAVGLKQIVADLLDE